MHNRARFNVDELKKLIQQEQEEFIKTASLEEIDSLFEGGGGGGSSSSSGDSSSSGSSSGDWTDGNYIMLHLFDGESSYAEAGPNYDTSNILSAYLVDENMDTLLADGLDIPLRIESADSEIDENTIRLLNSNYFTQIVYHYDARADHIFVYLNELTKDPEGFDIDK